MSDEMKIERFTAQAVLDRDLDLAVPLMWREPCGQYVLYTDYAALQQQLAAAREALQSADAGCGACGDGCAKRGACRLAEESPPSGTWLWCQLMDWCKARRVSPAEYNDLFAIAAKAHERDATLQRDRQP